MAQIVVHAEEREQLGKNANRRLRNSGRIPAVVYGKNMDTLPVKVDPRDIDRILHSETGHNTIFKLDIDGQSRDVLIREYQLDPVKGTLLHADLLSVAMDVVRVFEVPVQAIGTPKGVKEGGILDIVMRHVEVECLPENVPDHIRIEVSDLEVGDAIRVSELPIDTTKIEMLSDPSQVVMTVVPPHVEEEPEEVPVEEEMLEPELIKKGRAEEEEEEEEEKEAEEAPEE